MAPFVELIPVDMSDPLVGPPLRGRVRPYRRSVRTMRRIGPTDASATRVAEPALAAFGVRQLVDLDQVGVLDGLDHELRDALALRDLEGFARVGVDQEHLELAPVSRVDQAGGVEARDAVLRRQAA